jgi:hypothetical protein
MTGTQAPPLTVVRPGEGRTGDLGTIGVVFKLWGQDTGGALSVVEHPFPVGALVPPHTHTREDEYSIVTEGEIGFRSGDREVVLSPAGFEGLFREVADLVAAGPPPFDTVAALAASYGLEFGDAPWLPDVIARYGLNPPPAP